MDAYIGAFVRLNNALYTFIFFILIFAALTGWKRTRHWPLLLLAIALSLPLIRSIAMEGYAFWTLRDLTGAALNEARVSVLRAKVWILQLVNVVEFSLLLIGGLGVLFSSRFSQPSPPADKDS